MDNNFCHRSKLGLVGALFVAYSSCASAFTINLERGEFYGPGDTGVHPFPDAAVKNIVFTGPLVGYVPFANNGAAIPNAIAEKRNVDYPIDGLTSDGTPINENLDTALFLDLTDPHTGESAQIMAIAEAGDTPDGREMMLPDEKGNLTFKTKVVADPGDAALVRRFEVFFTSGAATIPLSLKTQLGISGGQDNAGPLQAGHTLIGRIGDSNRDGYIDGVLVLASNPALDLVVVQGNPIAQRRPFSSDIPIDPMQAATLSIHGVVVNFPQALQESLIQGNIEQAIRYVQDINGRLNITLGNIRDAMASMDSAQMDPRMMMSVKRIIKHVKKTRHKFQHVGVTLEKGMMSNRDNSHDDDHDGDDNKSDNHGIEQKIRGAFETLAKAFSIMQQLQAPM